MNLKYKILWIENDADWALSIEDEIKDIVEDNGFVFEKRLIDKRQENFDYKDYDFILMDMKLSSEPSGDKLIKDIRNQGVLTTVLFYSASELSVLRNKVQENELEGVFVASRTDPNLFLDKIRKLIETTIRKVQDLNNLRGLVMAEVSELDVMMADIIISFFTTEELVKKFHEHVTNKREDLWKDSLILPEGVSCNRKCTHFWKTKHIPEIVPDMESYQKAQAVNLLRERKEKFLDHFTHEIIRMRNDLAHCESQIEDGKEILKTRKGDVYFDEAKFVEIRKNIKKYHDLFEEMLQRMQ